MTNQNTLLSGAFLHATAANSNQTYAIPHWMNHPESLKQTIETVGDQSLPAGIFPMNDRPYHCRVFLAAAKHEEQIGFLEKTLPGVEFIASRRDIMKIGADSESPAKLVALPAYVRPGIFNQLANHDLVIGLRPFRDERYADVMNEVKSSLAAMPA